VSEDAGIKSRTFATLTSTFRRSNKELGTKNGKSEQQLTPTINTHYITTNSQDPATTAGSDTRQWRQKFTLCYYCQVNTSWENI
jgi:hypothetical protein